MHNQMDRPMSASHLGHVNARTVQVWSGQEMVLLDIFAATLVEWYDIVGELRPVVDGAVADWYDLTTSIMKSRG